jgi:hypothetical protein
MQYASIPKQSQPPLKEITNGREARSLHLNVHNKYKIVRNRFPIFIPNWHSPSLLYKIFSVLLSCMFSNHIFMGLNTRLVGEGFSSLATVFVAVDLELACYE